MTSRRILRQTMTIARRDFIATVFTPTFLIFLLAPLLMFGFGAVGGMGAASVNSSGADKLRMIAIVDAREGAALQAADTSLRRVFRNREAPPPLIIEAPAADPANQQRAVFDRDDVEVTAALRGPLATPTILHTANSTRSSAYLAALAEAALLVERSGGATELSTPKMERVERVVASRSGQGQTAFFAVFGIFLLTLMLASQSVGTMMEERSNKVIEVLAAAVPLESVFLGKLIGMFGVAVLFVGFWGAVASRIGQFLPAGFARAFAEAGPAIGYPAFPLLFFAYFTMAFLLLGAVFLGIGAQASTPRELQMLSLPITLVQVGVFGLSATAASQPDGMIARVAEIFPFSSPFAMAARAANKPELWPHFLALGWQGLWVAITVAIGARLFRRGVLQSGSPKLRLKALWGG